MLQTFILTLLKVNEGIEITEETADEMLFVRRRNAYLFAFKGMTVQITNCSIAARNSDTEEIPVPFCTHKCAEKVRLFSCRNQHEPTMHCLPH